MGIGSLQNEIVSDLDLTMKHVFQKEFNNFEEKKSGTIHEILHE